MPHTGSIEDDLDCQNTDIGRHGDLELKISTNLKKGVMQGETTRVIK